MMGREVGLTVIRGGINRLKTKGGATANALYDLKNGYVTKEGGIKVRPGTQRDTTLPSNTVGLATYNGQLVTFAITITTVPAGYVCYVLTNPLDVTDALVKIHFAQAYLGFLYVVAQFASGKIQHFWLQSSGAWAASKDYTIGTVVTPTTPNGLFYTATRVSSPNPAWAPNTPETTGAVVEPTTYNGFFYTATEVDGTNPHTGLTEPGWPTTDGAQVIEQADGQLSSAPTVTPNPTNTLPTAVQNRYKNPYNGAV
jgi:hypothetical protein